VPPGTAEPSSLPDGLVYREEFITAEEERTLLDLLDVLDFRPVVMRGRTARRSIRHFGLEYSYQRKELAPADPLPEPMLWLRDRCAEFMARDSADLVQVIVGRYPPGAGIGWHQDAPIFGSGIAGVSLLGRCRMRFQRRLDGKRSVAELELEPRSAYLMSGAARWDWQHSIPATKALRYSVTFRTLRRE
jgi:alkylated DNA repair protein (DNA oxidative demethylase)